MRTMACAIAFSFVLSGFFDIHGLTGPPARGEPPPADTTERTIQRLYRRAAADVTKRRFRAAYRSYREALLLDPLLTDTYYNLVVVSRALRRCDLVALYGRGLIYLDRASPEAKRARKLLQRCETRVARDVGRVTLFSDPEGAEVYIDGAIQGRTPQFELELASGPHTVRLTHPECAPLKRTFGLERGQSLELEPKLERLRFEGLLMVRTTPATGVTVLLDERPVARTPLKEPLRLETRRYLLRLDLPGWDRWIRYVDIRRDRLTRVDAVLEQTEQFEVGPRPDKLPPPPPPTVPILRE